MYHKLLIIAQCGKKIPKGKKAAILKKISNFKMKFSDSLLKDSFFQIEIILLQSSY
jgi:hypothetical protein